MSSFAEHADYELITGQTLPEDRAEVLLEEASALIRVHAPGIDDRMGDAAGQVPEEIVKGITVRIVQRYVENPTLASQIVDGPFSRSFSNVNARGMFLTEDEKSSLNPPVSNTTLPPSIGSFRLGTTVLPRRRCW